MANNSKITNQEYAALVKQRAGKSPLGRDMAWAFLVGGAICTAGQGLSNLYQNWGMDQDAAGGAVSITLILLSLTGRLFGHDRAVYVSVTTFTLVGAVYDLLRTLPDGLRAACRLDGFLAVVKETLPLAELGLGWVCPALLGLVIGLGIHFLRGGKRAGK